MKKYIETMRHIYPTQSQKDNMFERALKEKTHRKKPVLRYCIASAVAAVVCSTVVFADEIHNTFYNLLGKDEIIAEDVLNDVYTDTDDHIRMSVKELLSDKITAYAVIEYTALDDIGKKWLDGATSLTDGVINGVYAPQIHPCFKEENTALYGVNYSYICEELTDYRTENSYVFKTEYQASGENYGTDSIILDYHMPERYENQAVIDVTESIQLTDIKVDGVKLPDKHYRIQGVKISPMSIMVYGENCGLYESGTNQYGSYYIRSLVNEEINSIYLVMKDESRIDLHGGFSLTSVSNPEIDYEVSICAESFDESIDISLVDGIELDGVYYDLGL